jgi:hypothetical protein
MSRSRSQRPIHSDQTPRFVSHSINRSAPRRARAHREETVAVGDRLVITLRSRLKQAIEVGAGALVRGFEGLTTNGTGKEGFSPGGRGGRTEEGGALFQELVGSGLWVSFGRQISLLPLTIASQVSREGFILNRAICPATSNGKAIAKWPVAMNSTRP